MAVPFNVIFTLLPICNKNKSTLDKFLHCSQDNNRFRRILLLGVDLFSFEMKRHPVFTFAAPPNVVTHVFCAPLSIVGR